MLEVLDINFNDVDLDWASEDIIYPNTDIESMKTTTHNQSFQPNALKRTSELGR